MSIVWVMHPVKQDLIKAERYGSLRYINSYFTCMDDLVRGMLMPSMLERMNCAANELDPDRDWVLLVGDHAQLMQFVFFLGEKRKQPRLLRWDRRAFAYYPVQLTVASVPYPLTRRKGHDGMIPLPNSEFEQL